jgi:hypothetical protein
MNDNKFIFKFKNKNYIFFVNKLDEKYVEFMYDCKLKQKVNIEISNISLYLSKLNKRKENTNSNINEKIDEYIQFIQIISHDIQIIKAIEQLAILLWENTNYLNKNKKTIRTFFIKYMNLNLNDAFKYYFFLLFNLDSINSIKIQKNIDDMCQIDWLLDNLNCNTHNFDEEEIITDFIIN